MTSRRRESCDDAYRRACRLHGTGWAQKEAQEELMKFTSMVFSVSTGTLEGDIISEVKKMGKPPVAAAGAATTNKIPAWKTPPEKKVEPTTCAVCGNPLVNGRCKFVNHKVS